MRQAEQLEAARVGQHRTVVAHELLNAACFFNKVGAGTHIQMIRVRQDNLASQLVKLVDRDALDRGMRAHWHEHRGLEAAMRGFVAARTRVPACSFNRVIEKRHLRFLLGR